MPYTEFVFILRKAHLIRTQAATQNSLATAGTHFTGVQNKVDPCRGGEARNGQMVNDLETPGVIFLTRNIAFVWVVRSNMHHTFMT